MNKNKGGVSVGLVVLIAALAFAGGALVALFARPAAPIGGFSGNSFLVPLVVEDTAEFNADVQFDSTVDLGAETTLSNCGTALYTLGALEGIGNATSGPTIASTTVSVTGAAVGDVAFASFATGSVAQVDVTANITAAAVATVFFENLSPNTLPARSSSATITVCYFN